MSQFKLRTLHREGGVEGVGTERENEGEAQGEMAAGESILP